MRLTGVKVPVTVLAELPWRDARESLKRPYRVTIPMVVLVCLVPLYLFIAAVIESRPVHAPTTPLDRLIPLVPFWSLVYGALYLVLIIAPIFIVRDEELLRRTVWSYLTVWLTAYACFYMYPTYAPRPDSVPGSGFGAWGLRLLYSSDPPYNCFPSIHVAHSFVSAFACHRVHRRLGRLALGAAALVALSTLFTKQHYVLDVVAGIGMAVGVNAVLLRTYSRERVPALDRRIAPAFGVGISALVLLLLAGYYALYVSGVADRLILD